MRRKKCWLEWKNERTTPEERDIPGRGANCVRFSEPAGGGTKTAAAFGG